MRKALTICPNNQSYEPACYISFFCITADGHKGLRWRHLKRNFRVRPAIAKKIATLPQAVVVFFTNISSSTFYAASAKKIVAFTTYSNADLDST